MNTFDDEKLMQRYADEYYLSRGYNFNRSGSCKQYDVRIHQNGASYLVEEKFNFTDRSYDRMIVELIQDAKSGDLGWFYHVNCDSLFWFYCPADRQSRPNILYVIDWPYFKDYVIGKMNGWINMHYNNKGYGLTLNIPINLNEICTDGLADKIILNQQTLWNDGI